MVFHGFPWFLNVMFKSGPNLFNSKVPDTSEIWQMVGVDSLHLNSMVLVTMTDMFIIFRVFRITEGEGRDLAP